MSAFRTYLSDFVNCSKPTRAKILRRLCRETRGAYAVEFALTGSVFIVILIVVFQYALLFLARSSLNLALETAARGILTGNFQKANAASSSQAEILDSLKASICGPGSMTHSWMFSCANLKIDVNVLSSFAAKQSNSAAIDGKTGTWASSFGATYVCPGPKSIAVVRAAVKYPVFARGLSFGLSAFADGSALLQSAMVFRVEQYQSVSGSTC